MKLEKILDQVNSFEKNSFLKILDTIISEKPANHKEIDDILSDKSGALKAMDSQNVSSVFHLVSNEFSGYLKNEFLHATSQIDILTDIITRDGNCIMKLDWISRLYETEIKDLRKKIKAFESEMDNEKSELDPVRRKYYQIYRSCVRTAYHNNDYNNQDRKITFNEHTILITLAEELELSNEEIKLINYMIVPLKQLSIETVINELKNVGVIFYSKKSNIVYVADEIVTIIRKLKGKKVADKFFRRVLRYIREPQINMACRKHNINWRQPLDDKIKTIINEGISFTGLLSNDIHKDDTLVTDKKKYINELCDKKLKIKPSIKGVTLPEKLDNLIAHFDEVEADDKVGISVDGYERLLTELDVALPKVKDIIKKEFELQEQNIMKSFYLLDYNIKPVDVLEMIPEDDLKQLCSHLSVSTRGDLVANVLENYKDAENMYMENYALIGYRNLSKLKENGIQIKEAELGILFENITKKIFTQLGFNVDESLRKSLNNAKNQADIVLKISNDEIILIECKTVKEKGYNKFSSVSRQIKSYIQLAEKKEYKVVKSLLVAPEFSDEFIKDCGLDYELNLSLISATSLLKILEMFKISKHDVFPQNLLMRDVLIQEERVLKAISK